MAVGSAFTNTHQGNITASTWDGPVRLFETFERTRQIPMARQTTHFEGLNECADPEVEYARSFVEQWFERFPEGGDKRDLRARLTSKDDRQHQDALFELYLHELLTRMGYDVRVHAASGGDNRRQPDFLALKDGEPVFYLEATTARHSDARFSEQKRLDAIYEALNKIESPDFWLNTRQFGDLQSAPKIGPLCQKVGAWVATLDPRRVASGSWLDDRSVFSWDEGNWHLELRPMLKPTHLRGVPGVGTLGLQGGRAKFVVPEEGILHAIQTKGDRYGDLKLPFVIAVNTLDDCNRGVDVWKGLLRAWGSERSQRYRHISAALIAWIPVAVAAPRETPWLVHHPQPSRRLPVELWPLPQYKLTERSLEPLANVESKAPALLGLEWMRQAI